jgi:hypothetical protein
MGKKLTKKSKKMISNYFSFTANKNCGQFIDEWEGQHHVNVHGDRHLLYEEVEHKGIVEEFDGGKKKEKNKKLATMAGAFQKVGGNINNENNQIDRFEKSCPTNLAQIQTTIIIRQCPPPCQIHRIHHLLPHHQVPPLPVPQFQMELADPKLWPMDSINKTIK